MTYDQWLSAMVTTLNLSDGPGVAAFTAMAPRIIEYAELRLLRDPELDFLVVRDSDNKKVTTGTTRVVAVPSQFIIIEGVALLLPADATLGTSAQRLRLLPVSREFIDMTWPSESKVMSPAPFETYFVLYSNEVAVTPTSGELPPLPLPNAVLIAPTPDAVYHVEFTGVVRPKPLSALNEQTFLSTWMPDLFFAATMIIAAGFQRDYGAQSDDPKLAQSWEAQYQALRHGAVVESARQKFQGASWTSFPSPPVANQPRATLPPPPPPTR